ncbi:hypothetical protein [Geomicrobium sp. JCM 19038]|uniref:hypothetical protein n=1 Tax=Geomicrobium sp. JCM 19038 TaxID=1460635 RepID=UPI00045F23CC|nr:hypothetical protein [Geomicrobium sp. JCM 19038]GAK06845.1 hypothetical protein JCM19038_554 [Geomicrobium sp. JCM 19038]
MQRLYYAIVLSIVFIGLALESTLLLSLCGILSLPMFFYSFYRSNRLFKGMGLAFLVIGAVLLPFSTISFNELPQLFSSNLTLVVFVAIVPLMQAAIETLYYDRNVNAWLFTRANTTGKVENRALLTTYGFVPFMNFSILPLLQNTLNDHLSELPKKTRNSIISKSTLRAYALALVWMPMEIMVVTAIGLTGESYFSLLPYLLLLSVTMTIIEMVRPRVLKGTSLNLINDYTNAKGRSKGSLVTAVVVFLLLVTLIGEWLELSFLLTVILLIPLFSYTWTLLFGKSKPFIANGQSALGKQLKTGIHPFLVLFMSLGWFTGILNQTELLTIVQEPLRAFEEHPYVLLLLIPLSFYSLALIGIHPIASMVLVHEIVAPILQPGMPIELTVMYIVSALATFTMSPYGIVVTMTARHTNQNPYRIMLTNLPFALLFGVIAVGLLILIP